MHTELSVVLYSVRKIFTSFILCLKAPTKFFRVTHSLLDTVQIRDKFYETNHGSAKDTMNNYIIDRVLNGCTYYALNL